MRKPFVPVELKGKMSWEYGSLSSRGTYPRQILLLGFSVSVPEMLS